MGITPAHPLEIGFRRPFAHELIQFGLFGVQANAFLAGALDTDSGAPWYYHPLLREWRCQFRREAGLGLEAEWLGEWLGLLRLEGARSLRVHTERYTRDQQKYYPGKIEAGGLVFTACKHGQFGEARLSSWTPMREEPRARRERRNGAPEFDFPVGVPAEAGIDLFMRTHEVLRGGDFTPPAAASLMARLDVLYARAADAGYLLPALAVDAETRLERVLARLQADAPQAPHAAHPALPNDPQAEDARRVLLHAGVLADQLAQVPARVPQHPYDDENTGPIYPASDPEGAAYAAVADGLKALGLDWLRLCYRPWSPAPREDARRRLSPRSPVDLLYLRAEAAERGEPLRAMKTDEDEMDV